MCSPKAITWMPLSPDVLKLNTDASVRNKKAAGDGLIRNHQGEVIHAFCKDLGEMDALQAEARALCQGLDFCWSKGFLGINAEVDSQTLFLLATSNKYATWPLCNVIEKIRWLLKQLQGELVHIYKEANAVADALAGLHVSRHATFHSIHQLPGSIKSRIRLDCRSFPYLCLLHVKESRSSTPRLFSNIIMAIKPFNF